MSIQKFKIVHFSENKVGIQSTLAKSEDDCLIVKHDMSAISITGEYTEGEARGILRFLGGENFDDGVFNNYCSLFTDEATALNAKKDIAIVHPTLGRIVHYVEGTRKVAAIIAKVNGNGSVDLRIFPPDTSGHSLVPSKENVPFKSDDENQTFYWQWPEIK